MVGTGDPALKVLSDDTIEYSPGVEYGPLSTGMPNGYESPVGNVDCHGLALVVARSDPEINLL